MNQHAKNNAMWVGIAALLMLYFGWFAGTVGVSDNEFYNTTVDVFNWMLRIGGICLLIVAILCFARARIGLLFDAVISGIVGLIMTLCAAYWLACGGVVLQYLVYLFFGGLFLNAARGSWIAYAASGPESTVASSGGRGWFGVKPLEPPQPEPEPEPPHPASIRPKSLPDGDEPPPDGYLASLAKEDDEPPTASYE